MRIHPKYNKFHYYIYKEINQIKKDEKGKFINSLDNGILEYEYQYYTSNYNMNDYGHYYIIIQQIKEMELNAIFTIYPFRVANDIVLASQIKKRDSSKDHIVLAGALIVGIVLSLPNIILQILRRCRNQMTSSCFNFSMNILCHIVYGSLISEIYGIGDGSFIMTQVLGILYAFICFFCLLIALCGGPKTIYSVIYNLCKKLDDSKTLQDIVSYNRKLPPKICVRAIASHQESREVWTEYEEYDKPLYRTETTTNDDGTTSYREVFDHYEKDERIVRTHYSEWDRVDNGGGKMIGIPGTSYNRYEKSVEYRTVETWRQTKEYQYNSWQDETKSLSNIKYCSIIKAKFENKFSFDSDASNCIQQIKDELYEKGKTYDTDVSNKSIYTCPGLIEQHNCSLNDEEYQKIKKRFGNGCGYFWWFILFLLGYNSMFEAFARYEVGHENITISKYISNHNNCRAPYMKNDVNPPSISFNFIYTKIQQKSIEKKIKKGILNKEALDTPLIIID